MSDTKAIESWVIEAFKVCKILFPPKHLIGKKKKKKKLEMLLEMLLFDYSLNLNLFV